MTKNLHFETLLFGDGKNGFATQLRRCVEHPRVTVLSEREKYGAPFVSRYFVDGEVEYSTLAEAISHS